MTRTHLVIALIALAFCTAVAPAQSGDVMRLDIRGGTPGLDGDGDDTELVHGWRRGYYGYGFYRPYYYPRYYGPGFSYYYSRPFYSYGYAYYRPFVYSSYYAPYYYAPPVYYSPYYWCPISDSSPAMPYAASTGTSYTVLRPEPATPPTLMPFPKPYADSTMPTPTNPGTYPYDGGPRNPVPMPGAQPVAPQRTVPLEGKAVSLPRTESKYTYPAYGESRPAFAEDRVIAVTAPSSSSAAR
jgi:hypothetical protein